MKPILSSLLVAASCGSAEVEERQGDASITHLQRCAAAYVDKIIKGAKPADFPVQQPS